MNITSQTQIILYCNFKSGNTKPLTLLNKIRIKIYLKWTLDDKPSYILRVFVVLVDGYEFMLNMINKTEFF